MLLAACSHAKQPVAVASVAPLSSYPPGIVPPADYAGALRAGIYPSDAPGQCCFLAGRSLLVLDNPTGAQLAVFTFYVPSLRPLQQHPERVFVTFDGLHAGSAQLVPGLQNVTFTIPKPVRKTRHLVAGLTMSVHYVPKKIGLNPDTRDLSVVLTKVGYI